YGIILHSSDREKRKEAYEKYYSAYTSLINTITSIYGGNVKKNVFLSKVYKFNSCLESALFSEDVDRSVYDNLIKAVDKNLPAMHRYIADRKKILGYDKLHFYDINAPLVDGVDVKYTYDEAYALVIKGLAPLGKDYQALLKKGYDERWLDVEETEGKGGGAYSIGCPDCHPYVLLNYQPTMNEVFTIAHEMGHALHTWFSQKNQPYAKSQYKIFVAEVASTVNETLLLKYMLKDAKDGNLKKYLLNYYLDSMRATLHRQAMFAEFEYEAHTLAEKDQPLTKEVLCDLYAGIGKKYYGGQIEHDYNISCEWVRIPHFYHAFYVYKYATGLTAAINIANRILKEGEPAVKDYFKFLSSGSSSDPVSLLKLAGVDLSKTEPFEIAMREFEDTLTEFEKLMGI
ncbi:MAG: oligoendopeptidase F family protein, partial [Clostridia bacterium]|nr:oligoendopeptidase F family protein [Clostridia bacterium]